MSSGISVRWRADPRGHAEQERRDAAADALADAAEFVLETANRTVPIEEHTLEASGSVSVDRDRLEASVAYDTPYARRQHEDTRLAHNAGRQAKWLERTLPEVAGDVRELVARRIGEATR